MQGKLHGFLPKATRELPMKDYLAKRSSQWSTLRSRRRSIAAGGLTMMSEQKAVESADMMKKRDTLAQMPLLAGMSEESMESLLPLIETIDIDTEGHELIREGVIPTHFFILVSATAPEVLALTLPLSFPLCLTPRPRLRVTSKSSSRAVQP